MSSSVPSLTPDFWQARYEQSQIGWDIGAPSTPLKAYIDQLEDKNLRILLPGAGNAYEAAYLWQQGFRQVVVLDWAEAPLQAFAAQHPDFPKEQLIQADFFAHQGEYDLILEQTFFCALDPKLRAEYAAKMAQLLAPKGRLAGVWFHQVFENNQHPPFGGSAEDYIPLFEPYLQRKHSALCHNSIPPRAGTEWFFVWQLG
ncbi:methyltransferase domain-containing protein [Eisenibacter elegans]|jgi:hypothetical protein|uniref:methyltransferase domain-containing protein n=1 Tax=Eisenibacter elegans TaxID=997 RepID=UPI00040BE40B|nr:methyltransferase domain-containing protein [Eisenibacter elegans]